jgi:hypothetical protein
MVVGTRSWPEAPFSLWFRFIDPSQQSFGADHKGSVSDCLGHRGLLAHSLVGPAPHPLGLVGKRCVRAGGAAKALSPLVRAPERPVGCVLALAGVREATTMPAREVAPGSVELADPATTGHALQYARADEIRARSSKATGHADDADGLRHIFPAAPVDVDAIGQIRRSVSARRLIEATFSPLFVIGRKS